MVRRRKMRFVEVPPVATEFMPNQGANRGGMEIVLPIEGLEAIRLSDYEGLDQEAAAARMKVSRQTFGRILAEARKIVAKALVEGMVLRIDGGHFEFPPRHRRRRGQGWNRCPF